MRTISVLSLALLAGCAAAMEQPDVPILRPRYEVLAINGTVEPVVFAVERGTRRAAQRREPCETNDPMPTGNFKDAPQQMLSVRPLHVAAMPNYCPVTAPRTNKSVTTRAPRPPRKVQRPEPSEPQP